MVLEKQIWVIVPCLFLFFSQMKFDQEGNVTSFGKCRDMPAVVMMNKSRLLLRLMIDYRLCSVIHSPSPFSPESRYNFQYVSGAHVVILAVHS